MRDIVNLEKKAWLDLVDELKEISKKVSSGKDIDSSIAGLSKSIKKYRHLHDKKLSLLREPSKV